MNMKNVLLTTGISLITAGIGFIVGSKWTEKEIKQRTEDFYQKEYDLLKKRFEEDKEQEIRDDQKRKDAEMAEECHRMQEGIRRHIHGHDTPDQDDLEDEEELEEFGERHFQFCRFFYECRVICEVEIIKTGNLGFAHAECIGHCLHGKRFFGLCS